MSEHPLTRRHVVLKDDPVGATAEDRFFVYPEDDVPDKEALHLPVDTWKDMGSPEFITVTIQPGDMLQGQGDWEPRG